MKKVINNILASAFMVLASCSQISFGDDFLGSHPESSGADLEVMFSCKAEAEKVLAESYRNLTYGLPTSLNNKLGVNILESLTDLCHSFRDNISDGPMKYYYNGALNASNVNGNAAYHFGGETDWKAIRYAWIFIENAERVPDYADEERARRIAEAKVIIALSYFDMLRYAGGVPWLDHAVDVNEPMEFPRLTFASTVDNIVGLLDEAIPFLKWKEDAVNDGRMTAAGAMALKFKVLQWAASPAFNNDVLWHPQADEYTCYGDYDPQRWERAMEAGKEFFDALAQKGGYGLIQPLSPDHHSRREAYRKAYYDRGGTETLISTRHGYEESAHNPYFNIRHYLGPTLNYVDMFPWEDGADFPEDFDWKNPPKQPFFACDGEKMVPTRDPRLYENVVCPGDRYFDGTIAPVYVNHPSSREGSGFLVMKYVLQQRSDRVGRPVHWSYLRLAEIMLDYAEVLNEVSDSPSPDAFAMVDQVRARVGLCGISPELDKDAFRETVLREKALELGFEEARWFDLVRHDRQEDFTKPLYGLKSRGNDLNNPTEFTFEKISLPQRHWQSEWDTRWYMAPVPQNEINKNYGMTQNPGW